MIIPELRVLALTKRHVGSGNEIASRLVEVLRLLEDWLKGFLKGLFVVSGSVIILKIAGFVVSQNEANRYV